MALGAALIALGTGPERFGDAKRPVDRAAAHCLPILVGHYAAHCRASVGRCVLGAKHARADLPTGHREHHQPGHPEHRHSGGDFCTGKQLHYLEDIVGADQQRAVIKRHAHGQRHRPGDVYFQYLVGVVDLKPASH